MKKGLFLCLLFLCTLLSAEVIFYDNFNRTNGTVGNGWVNVGTPNASIQSNAMRILSDNGKGIRHDFTAISSGIYYIQYDWKIVANDWYADSFPTGSITHLIIDDAGNLCYDVDGSMSDPIVLQAFGLNVYHTVRLKVNLDTDNFSVWVDNVLRADDLSGTAVSSFTRFTFRAGLGANVTQFIDNFIVFNDVVPATPTNFSATGHVNDITLAWDAAAVPIT